MSFQGRISRAGGTKVKRALGVQATLEWAFRIEKAQLYLPPPQDVTEEGFGFGLEYVLLQRAALGCKIDGGQYKIGGYTHEDAEVIAATVAGMPDSLGGKRMAIRVAELARAGLTPDWMPGAVPRCVPVEVRRNQHGDARASAAASAARRTAISEAVSGMPKSYHNTDENTNETKEILAFNPPRQAAASSVDCANRSLPEDSRAELPKREPHRSGSPAR